MAQIRWEGFLVEDEKEEHNVCGGFSELESVAIADMYATCCSAMDQNHFCEAGGSLLIDIRGRFPFFSSSSLLSIFFFIFCIYLNLWVHFYLCENFFLSFR